MKKYFPILVSKKGERVALQHLSQENKELIVPIIQVLNESLLKQDKNNPSELILSDDLIKYFRTHWSFFGNQIKLDFSLFENIDIQINNIKEFITHVIYCGVNLTPVIQKDSSKKYLNLVKQIISQYNSEICIRISDIEDILFIKSIIDETKIIESKISLLIDLGEVNSKSRDLKEEYCNKFINELVKINTNWKNIIVSGSSFPKDLTNVDIEDELTRHEWILWNKLKKHNNKLDLLKYSDYGTKSSIYDNLTFSGTVSLKYSYGNKFIIFKGKKAKNHALGNSQFIIHAKKLVKRPEYANKDFSWGDYKYFEISNQDENDEESRKPGNSTNWIEYSQNHHIAYQLSLLD